ncbi:MAG: hypothetical protein K0V04_41700 [Deltaproteobacteria bacterium]|nr:hypothetical protein [Deltaproteobacteria bacterium]
MASHIVRHILRSLGLAATAGLVGYAGWLLLFDPDADDIVDDAIADANVETTKREEQEAHRAALQRVARGMALSPDGVRSEPEPIIEDEPEPAVTVPYGSGELDLQTVRSGFTYAMDRVDAVIKSRKRLDQQEWSRLYRETNDSFSALSIMLDATDEEQAAELEAAHKQLKKKLHRVRVRGAKFGS